MEMNRVVDIEKDKAEIRDRIVRLKGLRGMHDQTARCVAIEILHEASKGRHPYGTVTEWFVNDCIARFERTLEIIERVEKAESEDNGRAN